MRNIFLASVAAGAATFASACATAPLTDDCSEREAAADSRLSSAADPSFLAQYAETYRFRLGKPTSLTVVPDGSAVLFLRSGPRSFVKDLYEVDVKTGRERVLLTSDGILGDGPEKLSADELARRERMRMTARGIASYELSRDGKKLLVPLSGRLFVVDRATAKVSELASAASFPIDPQFSPDATKVTCVRDGDVYVTDLASGRETRITTRSSEAIAYGTAEFVAQEEMGRFRGTWWSPDSTTLVIQQTDTSQLETMHIFDPAHPDKAPQTWPYPRPGKANAAVRLGIVSAAGGEPVWVEWDSERYGYLATVVWEANAPLTMVVQNRTQTESAILAVDPVGGSTSLLHTERDEAWINLDVTVPRWLGDGSAFLWTTEREGAWQLELRDRSGKLIRAITPPDIGYRQLLHVDEVAGTVTFVASAEPTEEHLFRASLKEPGGVPEKLTEEPGLHGATFGELGSLYVHSLTPLEGRSSWTIRGGDAVAIGELTSVAEEPPFEVNATLETVGQRDLRAVVVRPRDFDPSRSYPVIVYAYAGPHVQMVSAAKSQYVLHQWLADHGYVVVSIDGRGTPSRGREWERAIKGNLIEAALEDQVAGLQALGAKHPEMDLTRVGVFGWSFGGYFSAMAVVQRGDVFHAAVAGAPVTDWLDYDTHYTERYMGLPDDNPRGYAASSVLTYADALERPLLILHGTADDNVYFTHSIKLSNALFLAGKDHELLPLTGFTHMVPDPLVTTRLYSRIMAHFQRSLQ